MASQAELRLRDAQHYYKRNLKFIMHNTHELEKVEREKAAAEKRIADLKASQERLRAETPELEKKVIAALGALSYEELCTENARAMERCGCEHRRDEHDEVTGKCSKCDCTQMSLPHPCPKCHEQGMPPHAACPHGPPKK